MLKSSLLTMDPLMIQSHAFRSSLVMLKSLSLSQICSMEAEIMLALNGPKNMVLSTSSF